MLPSRIRVSLSPPAAARALRSLVAGLSLLLLCVLVPPVPGSAQGVEPTAGVTDLALLLRQLEAERRVLMVAAHPDDEDTALLTVLARGMGARTGYLSLTRGEGGQNLIGPEMDEGLGLVRTGELLSARSLDGAEQFFSRAFDFGFSKSAEETLSQWPEEEVLADIVEVIRRFRPQVLLSVFHGTSGDGHGHHQAAGMLATRAFQVAADPQAFPEQLEAGLRPWAPAKLYRLLWRDRPAEAELRVETGGLDPLLGRSHFQVAMASRSRHRSQDMGAAELPGPQASRLELAASRGFGTDDPEAPLFAGIATDLLGMAEAAGGGMAISRSLQGFAQGIATARRTLNPENPAGVLSGLEGAWVDLEVSLSEARRSRGVAGSPEQEAGWAELEEALEFRVGRLSEALLVAAGVVVEARVDRALVTPGEPVEVELLVWNGGDRDLRLEGLEFRVPDGWEVEGGSPGAAAGGPLAVPAGELVRWTAVLRLPPETPVSVPYFLRLPRQGSLYAWPQGDPARTLPGNLPLVQAQVRLHLGSTPLQVSRAAAHVEVDKALGQIRRPLFVAPALSVSIDRSATAWPSHMEGSRSVTVRVRNLSTRPREGTVRLEAPQGWRVTPTRQEWRLGAEQEASFVFDYGPREAWAFLEAGASERAVFRAVAQVDGRDHDQDFTLIDYPHIDPVPMVTPAELEVSRFPVQVREGLRVGYVMGPGDGGLQALRDLGVEVELLDAEALRGADLSRYPVIVLGARAYETRDDLAQANARILAFARGGGTVIAQYNKYEYPEGGFAPYPVTMRRPHDRITDPDAAVTLLDPSHPLLRGPNRIGDEDFEGWVQERGLYFLETWDANFTPLLEMADPGEDPVRGGLVVASVGEGAYVYTGLSLFRQWPRGVPGAFRLLANLVSLRGESLPGPPPRGTNPP
jgi:LmbE family N-acetylglucosaminyl deacetylase